MGRASGAITPPGQVAIATGEEVTLTLQHNSPMIGAGLGASSKGARFDYSHLLRYPLCASVQGCERRRERRPRFEVVSFEKLQQRPHGLRSLRTNKQ